MLSCFIHASARPQSNARYSSEEPLQGCCGLRMQPWNRMLSSYTCVCKSSMRSNQVTCSAGEGSNVLGHAQHDRQHRRVHQQRQQHEDGREQHHLRLHFLQGGSRIRVL